jgi:biopolymer transport protein TolR
VASSPMDSDEMITGINITPLVDIVLVILIIFIVTASFVLKSSVPVELPRAASAQESPAGLIALTVTRDGALYINGREGGLDEIPAAVAAASARLPAGAAGPSAVISADVAARYGDFATLVDRLRLAGVVDIALDTQPPEPTRP